MLCFDPKDPQTSRIFGSNLHCRESLPSFNKSGPQVFWMMSKTPLVLREKSLLDFQGAFFQNFGVCSKNILNEGTGIGC